MSDQEGVAEKFALTVVGVLVIAIISSVVGFGAYRALHRPADAQASRQPAVTAGSDTELAAVEHIYFAVGQDRLPEEAADVLDRVAGVARSTTSNTVWVSGFHDASGNLADNQDLARRRAQAVLHALEANGVQRSRVVLNRPEQTTGGTDPAHARRVDIRVQ